MNDWTEICASPDLSRPAQGPCPITAVKFDSDEELIWTGNEAGRICSFHGASLQPYTCFRAHTDAVRAIRLTKKLVLSLSGTSLSARTRRGLVKWVIRDAALANATGMAPHPRNPHDIVVVGIARGMAIVNTERGAISEFVVCLEHAAQGKANSQSNGCEDVTIVLKNGRHLIAGSASGELRLYDAMDAGCPLVAKMQAHTGSFNDIVVCGHSILTCGYHQRYGQFSLETLIKVFDTRTLRPTLPIPFAAGPAFLRAHPKMTTNVFILSQSGQLQTIDVGNTLDLKLMQLTHGMQYITQFDLSPSGDAFVHVDADDHLHLWSQREQPRFTDFSNLTEFPDFPAPVETMTVDTDVPLHTIGMPYYHDELFSSWPATMVFRVGKPPAKIDADVLQNLKMVDGIGYAPFHKRRKRNLAEQDAPSNSLLLAPRFRSEKAKTPTMEAKDVFDEMAQMTLGISGVPNYYRRMEIQYSKFGIEDFDFDFFNNTRFAGLETSFANTYCNAVLQLYNYSPALSQTAISHASSDCIREACLLCEVGYLFGMLANGQNCQATNFLQAFSNNAEAQKLGLVMGDNALPALMPWANLAQSFNRFLLETMLRESAPAEVGQADSEILHKQAELDATISIFSKVISKCLCGLESVKPHVSVVTDLVYGKPVLSRKDNQTAQFASMLRLSIHHEGAVRTWCPACRAFQPSGIRRLVQTLPSVLNINAMCQTPEQWRHWQGRSWPPTRLGLSISGGKVQCLQGRDLDKRSASDGKVHLYVLTGLVCEIRVDDGSAAPESHLVTFVRVPEAVAAAGGAANAAAPAAVSGQGAKWLLLNDFLVKEVTEEEALGFPGPWKVPAMLTYERLERSSRDRHASVQVDTSILYSNHSLSKSSAKRADDFKPLSPSEPIGPGTLVAIDAEFVALQQEELEVRSDGTKHIIAPSRLSLARVSVLRGGGDHAGSPFIDDYIVTRQPVVNYLTEFSGIRDGDLDPERSAHALVPLKLAYKKLHALARLGCRFIGHGLKSDFRIINMNLAKDQVIDTVELFFIPERQRKLSLKFLSWYFLDAKIQQAEHDSVEDARYAYLLYQKYLEFERMGMVEAKLKEVYEEGRQLNFRPPGA